MCFLRKHEIEKNKDTEGNKQRERKTNVWIIDWRVSHGISTLQHHYDCTDTHTPCRSRTVHAPKHI